MSGKSKMRIRREEESSPLSLLCRVLPHGVAGLGRVEITAKHSPHFCLFFFGNVGDELARAMLRAVSNDAAGYREVPTTHQASGFCQQDHVCSG